MVKVEILNNRIYINSEMRDKELCKSIPGARFDRDHRMWHVPLSWAACKQLRGTFGNRLEIGEELIKWATQEVSERITPSMVLRDALTVSNSDGLSPGLYPFQQAGTQFLITARHALLGDPMGAGKTIQVIAAARFLNALPMLVVCPNSMKRTWKREIEKWWPGIPVYVVEGTAAKRAKCFALAAKSPGAVVINWESVRLHSRLAPYGSVTLSETEKTPKELNHIPFKLVVADEAHRMKDPKSKQTRAVWATAHAPTVDFRWALTGTPLTKAPDTLYPVLHFLSPTEWPGKTAYIDRYCMASFNAWGGLDIFGIKPDMESEFFSIFDPRFRRLPKEVILPDLPPITYERRDVEMNTKQRKAYDSMAESLFSETEDGSMLIARNPISQLTRLTQFASAYIEVTEDGARLSDPSCKLDQLMVDLDDYLSDDEGVVVFAQSRQLIRMASARLEKAGILHSVIEGGQTVETRQNVIDAFQEGKVSVILIVIAAGGVGLTLTRGRIGIFLQRSWSNVDQQQAIGRLHRIGAEHHESIVIIDYVTTGTIEEGQLEILAGKGEMLEEIVRDRTAIQRLLKGI
jgi:SNF2 family DNA or RNA helicase